MQLTHTKTLLAAITASAMVAGSASAGTIVSSSFNDISSGAVSTASAIDWGYVDESGLFGSGGTVDYNDTPFGSLTSGTTSTVITEVSGSSGIGTVALTEIGGTNGIGSKNITSPYTFDSVATQGAYGDFAGSEGDVWELNFNDLGVGTFTITLYMGHSRDNRVFDMDVTLTDGLDKDTLTTQSIAGGISNYTNAPDFGGNGGNIFTYDITVTTTNADADLSLVFGAVSGNSGEALLAGYTVVPEPGSLALLGLGGLLIGARRRRA